MGLRRGVEWPGLSLWERLCAAQSTGRALRSPGEPWGALLRSPAEEPCGGVGAELERYQGGYLAARALPRRVPSHSGSSAEERSRRPRETLLSWSPEARRARAGGAAAGGRPEPLGRPAPPEPGRRGRSSPSGSGLERAGTRRDRPSPASRRPRREAGRSRAAGSSARGSCAARARRRSRAAAN